MYDRNYVAYRSPKAQDIYEVVWKAAPQSKWENNKMSSREKAEALFAEKEAVGVMEVEIVFHAGYPYSGERKLLKSYRKEV